MTCGNHRKSLSVLVGGRGALHTIAAYIDLNAVPARIVEDPKPGFSPESMYWG